VIAIATEIYVGDLIASNSAVLLVWYRYSMGALDKQVGVRHPLTASQVQHMLRAGALDSGARVELLDGELFDMAPIGHAHGFFCQAIAALLSDLVEVWRVFGLMSLALSENDTVQPDICILSSAAAHHLETGPELSAVQFIVEVSDTTLAGVTPEE
jgi:hypothetical protein